MLAYVIRRLLILIPTLLGVSVIVFLMLHMTPGDPAELLLGERATVESLEQMREHLGLNEPLYIQYGLFLKRLLKGDLGETIWTRQKVWIEVQTTVSGHHRTVPCGAVHQLLLRCHFRDYFGHQAIFDF